jgi:hypothetical protein
MDLRKLLGIVSVPVEHYIIHDRFRSVLHSCLYGNGNTRNRVKRDLSVCLRGYLITNAKYMRCREFRNPK